MLDKLFLTAGRAIFTLSIPAIFRETMQATHPTDEPPKPWYTYRITRKAKSDRWPETWFVNLLAGPDNTQDYQPVGKLNVETGAIALVRSTRFTDKSWPVRLVRRVLVAIWEGRGQDVESAGFFLRHEGKCGRCGRRLTTPDSIDRGIGPECWGKLA
jgi:hypothetical protein